MNPIEVKFTVAANLEESVPDLLVQADGVINGFESQPSFFPNAAPIVQGLKDARKALADKGTATGTLRRSKQARSTEENTLRDRMKGAVRFTESCANDDPANGPAIIAASTFSEKAKGTRTKGPLTLARGPAQGDLAADAKAAKRGRSAYYWWRYSLDGTTWVEVAGTNVHKTLLQGLPVGKTVFVQVAITQSNIRGPWSDSVSLFVF